MRRVRSFTALSLGRSFQYVSDLVNGLVSLMNSNYTLPVNIGNPDEHTISTFAHLIRFAFHTVSHLKPVLLIRIRIRIHRIHMFLGLLDPDPDPLARGMNPDPSIIKGKK
jgi:nucleoside-diphosphate-sugar epimerase